MYTKWVIVVDDDIDARDWKSVMWALSTRMDPAVVEKVTGMWGQLGLPGDGRSIWK